MTSRCLELEIGYMTYTYTYHVPYTWGSVPSSLHSPSLGRQCSAGSGWKQPLPLRLKECIQSPSCWFAPSSSTHTKIRYTPSQTAKWKNRPFFPSNREGKRKGLLRLSSGYPGNTWASYSFLLNLQTWEEFELFLACPAQEFISWQQLISSN